MDWDLKELARANMREAMKKEINKNHDFIESNMIKRNTPRVIKEAVFYAISRNNALKHFLLLEDPIPVSLQYKVMITDDYRDLMHKAGATKYPLEIKRKAELDVFYDYTHIDYKRCRHFIDEALPEKPKLVEVIENIGGISGLVIVTGFRLWWVLIIILIGWVLFQSPSNSNIHPASSTGHNNILGAGGISGGNSSSKSVSDTTQVKDESGQAGFGNNGVSGHDAPSSAETNSRGSSGNAKAPMSYNNMSLDDSARESEASMSISSEPNEEKFDVEEGYFTLGSTKDMVFSVMGKPDNQTISSFSYGHSLVFFNNDKVSGWSRVDHYLKVSLGDKREGAAPFTVGSTRKQVVDAMGTPSAANSNSFTYGYSLVFFNSAGKVSGWSKTGGSQLKVKLGEKVDGAEPFTIGSTVHEVIAAMGTPDSYSENLLGYGYSLVFLLNGKVSNYRDISKNLKAKPISP